LPIAPTRSTRIPYRAGRLVTVRRSDPSEREALLDRDAYVAQLP
jgi:hypothetical protein